jgi:drug/metabolite transporter superfamily protein YnfA
MSDPTRTLAGVILLTIVTIEFGGWFLTKIARGQVPMTDFQKAFARAGHAHAGVLVILSLVGLLYVDQTSLSGFWLWIGRLALPVAAILMSGGFFASSAGKNLTQPNKFLAILWVGAASLAVGALTLGVGLITA